MCYRCGRMVAQVFPCFVCSKVFCLTHVFQHACLPQFAPIQHFVQPTLQRSKLSLAQYSRHKGPDSTIYLELLNAKQSMSGWSGENEALSGCHHIFPKSALVWVYEHMSAHQQKIIKKVLMLPPNSGGMALTRLRSNLISPRNLEGVIIRPEERNDDPHHHGGSGLIGEEFLDLVKTSSGVLEHRSRCLRQLAWFVAQIVAPRFFESDRDENFELTNGEATVITTLILKAETLHCYLETQPQLPSFHNSNFWKKSLISEKCYKGVVPDRKIPDYLVGRRGRRTIQENFSIIKREEQAKLKENFLESRSEEFNDPDPPRLRLLKSERLGGWREKPKPFKGSTGWLISQCVTQLEVDVASCIDRLIVKHHQGVGRWDADSMTLIKAIAGIFEKCYEQCRNIAQARYREDHQAYLYLPSFCGTISDLGVISLWIENSWPSKSTNYSKSKPWSELTMELILMFRTYPDWFVT